MKKICILGGTGFVGKTLVEKLSSKYDVHSPSRLQLNLMDFIEVNSYFENNHFDVVINCAADTRSQMVVPNEVLTHNVGIFTNIFSARHNFKRLLNFGSGAEFDRMTDIHYAHEDSLLASYPKDIYGMSKHVCSKLAYLTENCYTLRLFGVFGSDEAETRLLKRVKSGVPMILQDKYFDYFYVEDIVPVVDYYIETDIPKFKDINLVYPHKMLLSEFVHQYCNVNHLVSSHITVNGSIDLEYTGDSSKLETLDLPLMGVIEGLKKCQ